ncbi:MAG: SMP-30/gluconolactonase/LRE family protein [Bacteroidales bacterium]|nr:SMP-30/gluconolactonase/LRE family protein [Bacteroidales bacterium]
MKIFELLVGGTLLFASCSADKSLYKVSDYTPEKQFTSGIEGPACDREGNLYAVNYQKQGTIGKVNADGTIEMFVELPQGSIGNGIRFGQKNEIYVADYKAHHIFKINTDTRIITDFAHEESMSQPNDIAVSKRFIYASDPDWKTSSGRIWKIDSKGRFTLLESGMGTANGIEASPDDKLLYVNETVQRKIWVYNLDEYGNTRNKRLFYEFPDYGLDGMRCDDRGNLYVARREKGTVVVLSPEGKMLREIYLKGKIPTNVTFGGKDGKTLFVTVSDRGCIEKFKVKYKGRE